MKKAISQETMTDSSHSSVPERNENTASTGSLKSAAMLGIALSVGASGVMIGHTEAMAAVSAPTDASSTEAFTPSSSVSPAAPEESSLKVSGYHTVASGESLWEIAQKHRIGLRDLKSVNSLPPETSIRVGQVLKVPTAAAEGQNFASSGNINSTINNRSAQLIARVIDEPVDEMVTVVDAPAENARAQQQSISQQQPEKPAVVANLDEAVVAPGVSAAATSAAATRNEAVTLASSDIAISSNIEPTPAQAASAPAASIEIDIADDASYPDGLAVERPAESSTVVAALAVPAAPTNYRVQAGDTLNSIASALGTTPGELIRINGLANPNVIFAGATLRVPTPAAAETDERLAKKVSLPAASTVARPELRSAAEQLAYLRSTAANSPDAEVILSKLRNAAPEENASVGGEQIAEQDLFRLSETAAQSVDPYVASLLEDVQEVNSPANQVAEVDSSEAEVDSTLPATSEGTFGRTRTTQSLALANQPAAATANDVDSSLLAAAPLSPDAYTPAQRSSTGQLVSPDMPLLPDADEYLPEVPNHFDGYIWPARGTVTSGYGWRWGRMHRGVDVAGPVGTPIVAAAAGVVERAGWNSGGFGNLVEVRHADGSLTRYAHNNRLNVSAGQRVSQGQQIAEMGSTGYSTGPHLHFEVHKGGGAVNPVAYLP